MFLLPIFLGGPIGPIHPVWGHMLVSFCRGSSDRGDQQQGRGPTENQVLPRALYSDFFFEVGLQKILAVQFRATFEKSSPRVDDHFAQNQPVLSGRGVGL